MLARSDEYVFEALHLYDDPERNASKRLGRILSSVRKAGEVFHGLRGTGIDLYADEVTKGSRTVRQQSGHSGKDVHDEYGSKGLTESRAIEVHSIRLPQWLTELVLRLKDLDFDALAEEDRRYTRRNIAAAKRRAVSAIGQ